MLLRSSTVLLFALVAVAPPSSLTGALLDAALQQPQAEDPAAKQAERIERMIELARSGRRPVRPQAAMRLLTLGKPALDRLWELAREDAAGLGPELMAIFGRSGDARLQGVAWEVLKDVDFPWRPAAMAGLAASPQAKDRVRFEQRSSDTLAAVRAAAVEGLERLGSSESDGTLRARLADEDGTVRRRAARALVRRGDACAAHWLLAELERSDRFFALPSGKAARYEAWRMLQELGLTGELALDGEADPATTVELRAKLAARLGCEDAPELPPSALPGRAREGDLLGLELRSCRRGEYFLRWNEADELYVGQGLPARVSLAPGTVARLVELSEQALVELGDERFWGEPGCDLERIHLKGGQEALQLSLGPDGGEARPAALDAYMTALVESLPQEGADPRLEGLRGRVEEALRVLGGLPGQ